ncbi:hypothetical protein FRB90_000839 [Tulasnella sp. 427]|nr:hypothetical protein FRB90_000839 [Tulasnella sp. 427]
MSRLRAAREHALTTKSTLTRDFKHLLAPTKLHGYAASVLVREPRPGVRQHDRIKHWNIVPGDKVRIINGPYADKNAVREVASINKLTNKVYIKGLPGKGRRATGAHLKPEHYSNLQLLVGKYEVPGSTGGTPAVENVWATRLSTSKPFFIRKHGAWVWNRYAAATSLALPASDKAADVPARKNRIRIPWPSTKKEAKTPKAGQYDTLPEDALAITWTPPHPGSPVDLSTLEHLYIRHLHPTKSFFNPQPRQTPGANDLEETESAFDFDENAPIEHFLAAELSNPHSRTKKQKRWQERLAAQAALKEDFIKREMQRARRTGPGSELGGRRITPREARKVGTWKWQNALVKTKAEERQRRWVARGGEEARKRRHERSARKLRRQAERLQSLVLGKEKNQIRMKVVGLLSGGKDSCFNLIHCVQNGHEIIALASLSPPSGKGLCSVTGDPLSRLMDSIQLEEIDSYMYQTVGQDAIEVVAGALDLPLVRRVIAGTAVEQNSEYGERSALGSVRGDETEDMYELLATVKEKYPEVEAVSVEDLLSEMISAGMDAVLIKVAGIGLTDRHLGKSLAQMQPTLQKLNSLYGAHICGEGGEYETLTLDCPLFKSRIVLLETEIVVQDESNAGMVAYLRIKQAQLQPKSPQPSEVIVPPTLDERYIQIQDTVAATEKVAVREHHAVTNHPPLAEAHIRVRDKLGEHGLNLTHISHINVYISDMTLFARINGVYGTFFGTSPPTRACIAVDLPSNIRISMDCVAYAEDGPNERQALHVQGISYWASANIGPYSQAVAVGDELFVSGQIGLIPAQMQLPSPTSLATESALAFQHLDRITTLARANAGRDWAPAAQSAIIWTAGPHYFNGARAAWKTYNEESDYTIPVLFVACKTIPKAGCIEIQVLQHTGLTSVEDQETEMPEDKRVEPKSSVVRGENWELSSVTTDKISVTLLTVQDGVASDSQLPQRFKAILDKSISVRLFYTPNTAASRTVFDQAGVRGPLRSVPQPLKSIPTSPEARLFSSSSRVQATEDMDADYRIFVDRLKNSPQMQKIADSPGAMAALMDLAKILQDAGKYQYEPETINVRDDEVVEEFKKAGVELNSESMMQMFGNNPLSGPKK